MEESILRRFSTGMVIGVIFGLLIGSVGFANAVTPIKLLINGKYIQCDVPPQNINGRVLVPARFVAEALGASVSWDQVNQTVVVTGPGSVQPNTPTPISVNYSRNNPAPIGAKQTVTVDNILYKYVAEISINQVVRGDGAWQRIKAANMFNSAPGPNEEYILAKISIRMISVSGGKSIDVSPVNFEVFSENNVKYNMFYSVVPPEPSLSTELYTGAQHEGYAAFKVNKADANPKVAYGLKYDGTGGVWFKLR